MIANLFLYAFILICRLNAYFYALICFQYHIGRIGKLSNLTKLSASYNKLKGTIPSHVNILKFIDLFHLHGNQLEGNADLFEEHIPSNFIVDCGTTDISEKMVDCDTCSECCNEDGGCISDTKTWPGATMKSFKSEHGINPFLSILLIILACCIFLFSVSFLVPLAKERVPAMNCPYEEFQQDSINRFYLGDNKLGIFIALLTNAIQIGTTSVFFAAGDSTSETNDWGYSIR